MPRCSSLPAVMVVDLLVHAARGHDGASPVTSRRRARPGDVAGGRNPVVGIPRGTDVIVFMIHAPWHSQPMA